MSHRLPAVPGRRPEIPSLLLCAWNADAVRTLSRQSRMRFFMSLRVASGSSVPDPLPKDHDFCKTGPLAPLYKICGTCSVCVPVAGPASESVRDGNHLVLQIHMPCRYTGRRNPAPADQRRSAAGSRSPVSMEIYRIGDRYGSFCPDLSSLLQISVPPWSFLRSLQPIQSVSTDP